MHIPTRLPVAVAVTLLITSATYGRSHATETNEAPPAANAPLQVGSSDAVPANDYSVLKTWLCHPGLDGACNVDLTTTVVSANGTLTRESWKSNANAPIDCFYVYPTVSTDPTPNSEMNPDAAELNVIRQQFARFGSVCRLYAPIYRQVTLAQLLAVFRENPGRVVEILRSGSVAGASVYDDLAYGDVKDAWRYYLEHDNKGRGFVVIGHSQGSFVLARLIRQEIDGKPEQSRLVSAILLGTNIAVPPGKDVGGAFQHIPLCHSESMTGCLITYASFRSTVPPPTDTLFGKVADSNMVAACTNPASLGGGSGELHAYFDAKGGTISVQQTPKIKPWVVPEEPIETPWVSVPGMLTARCATKENATYLEVTVHAEPSGKRVDDITGDVIAGGHMLANWGLHLIDMNLAMGNLVEIVRH